MPGDRRTAKQPLIARRGDHQYTAGCGSIERFFKGALAFGGGLDQRQAQIEHTDTLLAQRMDRLR